jgi:predicted molibdopterin-dependent oxidoreductase YjgC
MDIETQSEEVYDLRRKSVELLLSEHRADCEAPCRVVCPAGYNIPLLNRLIAEGEIETALEYAEKEHKGIKPWCYKCPGFCENACRRKKIDIQVSIKNLNIWMYEKLHPETVGTDKTEIEKPVRRNRKFSSMAGKLEWAELHEWTKESREKTGRHTSIIINSTAVEEAGSCMHCDCRAAGDCRLRDISEELRIKDPRGKLVNAPAAKKINRASNLIFENAKCIKCGLCIRVCEDSDSEPALCFLNRGFVTILSEPLTYGFEETLITKARQVIEVCPTGALSYFRNNPKDEITTDSSDTK